MAQKEPVFSIVVPCFNQEPFLAETLDSVLQQTYPNWECLIVNDGSTDNSEVIIDKFVSKDARFVKINQTNQGLSQSRNNGILASKGIYILPLDGDDKIGKEYLQLAFDEFQKNRDAKLVYCEAQYFGTIKRRWKMRKFNYEDLLFENHIFCSAIFKKADFMKTDGYDANMKTGYEDWEFWIRFLDENAAVVKLPSVQFYYRQRENSMISFVKNNEKVKKTEQYIFEKHKEKYNAILKKEVGEEGFITGLKKIRNAVNTLKKIKKTVSYKTIYKLERETTYFIKKITGGEHS